jgi:F420-dependent oxidoreductase-like protein
MAPLGSDRRTAVVVFRRGIHFGSYGSVDDGPAVFDRLCAAVLIAEEAGFDAISLPDHAQQNRVGGGPDSPMFEAFTLLGALAMRTTTPRLLTLVSPVTLRAPWQLAKAVTTLDVLSRGRAVLGVGAGWDVAEHEAYGIDFPGIGERMDRLDDALAICRAMFRDRRATVIGNHYTVADAPNSPRPLAGTIPVLVAGGGERRTLDLVARYGDACNVAGDPATVHHKFDVLARHCERVGRDPAEITKTVFVFGTDDLAALATYAGAVAASGADGMAVVGPDDPGRIPAIGQVLADVFPG